MYYYQVRRLEHYQFNGGGEMSKPLKASLQWLALGMSFILVALYGYEVVAQRFGYDQEEPETLATPVKQPSSG